MSDLWKWSIRIGTVVCLLSLFLMLDYSATKSVVITEEDDLQGEGNLGPLIQSILEEKENYDFVVIINPAHGGANQGNVVDDLEEKEITLAVAKLLEKQADESDVGIFLVRQEDMDISNESRAGLISKVKPDMVLDIHVGADPDNERYLGTTVWYNSAFYSEKLTNVRLADIMEKNLVTAISGKANGIMADTEGKYPLLKMLSVPAVSVELGYLTNAQESALLDQEEYLEKIAQGLYQGILAVREEMK